NFRKNNGLTIDRPGDGHNVRHEIVNSNLLHIVSSFFHYDTTTVTTTVAPASAGLGTNVTDVMLGTDVSNVTWRSIWVCFPAPSVAVTMIVFAPSRSVTDFENAPSCTGIAP